jgi:hypothetical protein
MLEGPLHSTDWRGELSIGKPLKKRVGKPLWNGALYPNANLEALHPRFFGPAYFRKSLYREQQEADRLLQQIRCIFGNRKKNRKSEQLNDFKGVNQQNCSTGFSRKGHF